MDALLITRNDTELLLLLLVAFTGLNALFGFLRISDGLLGGDEPSVTLRRS